MAVAVPTWEMESGIESKNIIDFNGKVLVIGSGGREHALAWKLAQWERVTEVYVMPGNGGTEEEGSIIKNVPGIDISDNEAVIAWAKENDIGLTVVGPEDPLAAGIVDDMESEWLRVFGPSKAASQLESSKTFTKEICEKYNIPTAGYGSFTEDKAAKEYAEKLAEKWYPVVIKEDGLKQGKGVTIAQNHKEMMEAISTALTANYDKREAIGDGVEWEELDRVVIEEFLEWEELSMIFMIDRWWNIIPMSSSQDHKGRDNGNKGPNTGGMWAYSPADHLLQDQNTQDIIDTIIQPTIDAMKARGEDFSGFLYAGLMITKDGPKLLEYNVRFGDPETQPTMMRLESDFAEMCLAGSVDKLDIIEDVQWSTKKAVTIVLAANWYPGSYNKGEALTLPDVTGIDSVKIFHAGTKKDEKGNLITSGWRWLAVTGIADTYADAKKQAMIIIEQIEGENPDIYFYRTDIAQSAIDNEKMAA